MKIWVRDKCLDEINITVHVSFESCYTSFYLSSDYQWDYLKQYTVEPLLTKDSRYEISNLRNVFL